MTRVARIPAELGMLPFRASVAVAAGLLSANMIKSGAWQRLFYDVYIHVSAFDQHDHRMWCDAAKLTLPRGACFGGWSAAYLWGIDLLSPDAKVWLNLPMAVRTRPRDRVLTRRTPLPAGDLDRIADAPITTPIRTGFDLGRYVSRVDALISLDALCRRHVKVGDLRVYATDRWSWPHTRQLRELLPLVEPLSESPMETRLRLLLFDLGIPAPVAQCEIRTTDGRLIGRVDLAYPELMIAIEYEGDHHRERAQFQRDVARINALTEAGWLVLRFTADDVLRHPDRVASQLRKAVLDRQRSPGQWYTKVLLPA